MKYFLMICGAAMLLPATGFAATTGTINVTGNVPIFCDLTVQQEPGASDIPDISAGHTDRHIATVTENCNSPSGYTVTVATANTPDHTGQFVDTVSGDTHPFTITYNGVPMTPGGVVTDSPSLALGARKDVHITYPEDPTLTGSVAATYEETLTFTISAK